MSNTELSNKEKMDYLIDVNSWCGGGLPTECDIYEYIEHNVSSENEEAFSAWIEDMKKDNLKMLLPVYEECTEEYELHLGYMRTTKELRKLSVKPELGRASVKVQKELQGKDYSVDDVEQYLVQIIGKEKSKLISIKQKSPYGQKYSDWKTNNKYISYDYAIRGDKDQIKELEKMKHTDIIIEIYN